MTVLCKNCSPRKECFYYQNGETRTECKFYKPMTKQEYIQTCNTEQLAEFLSKLPMRPCIVCPKWETYCRSHSGSPCWEDGNEYDLWKAWLKQPHTRSEHEQPKTHDS